MKYIKLIFLLVPVFLFGQSNDYSYSVVSGNTAFMAIPANAANDLDVGDFSVGCWFKSTTEENQVFISSRNGGAYWQLIFLYITDVTGFRAYDGTGYDVRIEENVGNLHDGSWHFLLWSVDRSDANNSFMFIDGDTSATYDFRDVTADDLTRTDSVQISKYNDASYYTFQLDEFFIIKRILTYSEMSGIYNGTAIPSDIAECTQFFRFENDATDTMGNQDGVNFRGTYVSDTPFASYNVPSTATATGEYSKHNSYNGY